MIPLSARFRARVESLFKSQQSRAKEKANKNGRIIKPGYKLPFDRRQFTTWLFDKFGGEYGAIPCRYCRRPIDIYNSQLDHGTALKRGGSPGLGNLDAVCAPCNATKGQLTPEEFDFFLVKMREMGDHFHNGFAVQNITHRLESYSAMKATVNRAHIGKQKQVDRHVVAALGAYEDDDF